MWMISYCCMYYVYKGAVLRIFLDASNTRRHQTRHFRKRATPVPAEGPAYIVNFPRHCQFPLRTLQAQKWPGAGGGGAHLLRHI